MSWGDDWEQKSPATEADDPLEKKDQPTLHYGSVDEFVREFLRFAYRRTLPGRGKAPFWDPEWWKFDEAVMRLDALWREWESHRQNATGMSAWWRDHVDHHMPLLMSEQGPFQQSKLETEPNDPLPYATPPEGMFPDEREV